MTRTPRPDNPPPTLSTIWASQHCRREMPSDASVLAWVAMTVLIALVAIVGLFAAVVQ